MKFFLLIILTAMLMSSCTTVPTYGTNKNSSILCALNSAGEMNCFHAHNNYDGSNLHKMYPLDVKGLPEAPSMP